MIYNTQIRDYLVSPVRDIDARVELYNGSTLLKSFSSRDKLIEFTVERIGEENKFFGFGIAQKINVKLIDKNRELTISPNYSLKVVYAVQGQEVSPYPTFYISETNRDEKTNQLSITGYDLLKASSEKTVGELSLTAPYTTTTFISAASAVLGCPAWTTVNLSQTETAFTTSFTDGANFEGQESLREALNDIAEITQSVYYIDRNNRLTFKRLSKTASPNLIINKNAYIELTSGSTHILSQINKTTELGNNINSTTSGTGNIQYIRDNAFYELLTDSTVGSLLNSAIGYVGGLAITQFDCEWRGNFLLEPGDKLQIEAKNGTYITTYLLDDVIEYKGYLTEKTKWDYNPEEGEHSNPSTLGDILNQTYAKVDKVNKEISLVVKDQDGMKQEINQIKVSTDGIRLSVETLEAEVEKIADITIDEDAIVSKVEQKVNASVDAKDNAVKQEMTSLIEQTATSITSTITEKDNALKTELQSQITQTADSITSKVTAAQNRADSAYSYADDAYDYADDAYTLAEQTEDKFSWIVDSGTKASNMTLTDEFLSIIADEVVIDADVRLYGEMKLYASSSGSTYGGYLAYGSGSYGGGTSTGVMLMSKDEYSYFIATNAGVRMTYDDEYAVFCDDNGVTLDGDYRFRFATNVYCTTSGKSALGTSSYKWASVYATTGTIQTSDERAKNTINYGLDKYEELFMDLKPVFYKFNDGTSDRFHTGFISQDVENSMIKCGLDSKDFAGFIKSPVYEKELPNGEGDTSTAIIDYNYSLRYDEFVALNTHMIQKLMGRIDELEAEVKALKGE